MISEVKPRISATSSSRQHFLEHVHNLPRRWSVFRFTFPEALEQLPNLWVFVEYGTLVSTSNRILALRNDLRNYLPRVLQV